MRKTKSTPVCRQTSSHDGLGRFRRCDSDHIHATPLPIERYRSICECEQRVIFADTHVLAGVKLCTALPYDDVPSTHNLSAVAFNATTLSVGVTSVPRGTLSLLMGHPSTYSILTRTGPTPQRVVTRCSLATSFRKYGYNASNKRHADAREDDDRVLEELQAEPTNSCKVRSMFVQTWGISARSYSILHIEPRPMDALTWMS